MIVFELYNGAGLGDQLWCYAVTRSISKRLGYKFGIMTLEKFKAKDFLELDFGEKVIGGIGPEGGPPIELPEGIKFYYKEKVIRLSDGFDVSLFDNELYNIKDNTKIDGNMHTEKYFEGIKDEVKSWIKIKNDKKINVDDNICIIHIRGGDFLYTTAWLDRPYYINAINYMKSFNNNLTFKIITDDVKYSRSILPEIEIIGGALDPRDNSQSNHHNGGTLWKDYAIINDAKYLIIGASSFAWWATWTNKKVRKVIAPKYWAAYKQSDGSFWSTGDSYVKGWYWLDRNGQIKFGD